MNRSLRPYRRPRPDGNTEATESIVSLESALESGKIKATNPGELKRFERAFHFAPQKVVEYSAKMQKKVKPNISPKEKADLLFTYFLPEFFTSSMLISTEIESVARKNTEHEIIKKVMELSSKHSMVISGSLLNIIGRNIFNSMILVYPNGQIYIHNKDIPTQFPQ